MKKIAWQNMKHIVVLGLGKTGVSVLRYLQNKKQQDKKLANVQIRVFDSRSNPPGLDEAKQIFPPNADVSIWEVYPSLQ